MKTRKQFIFIDQVAQRESGSRWDRRFSGMFEHRAKVQHDNERRGHSVRERSVRVNDLFIFNMVL